jgi:hypothetical protein
MTTLPVFGFDLVTPGHLEQWLVRILAVLGGAAVGGTGAGLVAQVLTRMVAARSLPRLPLRIIRLLGAVTLGLAMALFLFGVGGGLGGGGTGWGLFGGRGTGSGNGASAHLTGTTEETSRKEPSRTDTGKARVVPEEASRIEVLGEPIQDDRWYRIEGQSERHTLAEVRRLVEQRRKEGPLRQLVIIVYLNSPDRDKNQVVQLRDLARDLGLTPSVEEPRRDAP